MSSIEVRTFNVKDRVAKIDSGKLTFSEATLSEYIETEGGYYDHFGSLLADAEHEMAIKELAHEVLYSERFKEHKENGCTEKLAEANSKADPDVGRAKREAIDAKHIVRVLQQHLRAWDKSHENAQSRGHFLRKEMDKLNRDILGRPDNYLEKQLDNIIKEATQEDVKSLVGT